MKIVIADPIFLTEEYRKRLEALGELEIYDSTPASQEEFLERIKDAEIVIVGRYGFTADAFHYAPKLKMISLWQTGYDNVDLDVATEQGVVVSNVPNYAFDSVAEFVSSPLHLICLGRSVLPMRGYTKENSIGDAMLADSSWARL